ncbi:MAG: glycosyltransferase, partial [Anaerolineae bacterium]
RVKGFNSDLWCHEDYELGLRLLAAGAVFVYAAEVTGVHHDQTDMSRVLRRHYAEGKADVYLLKKYPLPALHLPISTASYSFLSRGLRFLAFRQPSLGDKLADLLLPCLPLLEKLWLNGAWSHLFYHLHAYWYWRGVADQVEKPADVRQFFAQTGTEEAPFTPELTIDLAVGLETAETILDEKRPSSLRLCLNNHLIADIPAEPGKERLRGSHLRHMSATHLAGKTLQGMAIGRAQNGRSLPFNPDHSLIPPERQDDGAWTTDQYFYRAKKVVEIELTAPLPPIDIDGTTGLHALVRYRGEPVNWITLIGQNQNRISAEQLQQAISEQIGWSIVPLALRPTAKPAAEPFYPSISVIVCTRGRAAQLAGCLDALLAQNYANFEIIVVDNASQSQATARLAARLPVRYVREDRPGLDWARNRGIAESHYDILAFTDDDARPDAAWLQSIATAFAEPEVTAVTGPVLPAKLDTPYQNLFEFGYGGMSHGFKRRIIRRQDRTAADLLWASSYGVGANMAFRRTLFDQLAPFDVALDVGTPSNGGGDVELLHRVVANNHTLVYEPNALVWHEHRRETADFARLVRNNGRSFGCYLLTCARNRTVSKWTIFNFVRRNWFMGWIVSRLRTPNGFPRKFVWMELWAFLGSPLAYRRARHHAAQIAQRSLPTTRVTQTAVPTMQPLLPHEQKVG